MKGVDFSLALARPNSSPSKVASVRATASLSEAGLPKVCSHLGLALCELPGFGDLVEDPLGAHGAHGAAASSSSSGSASASAQAAALLAGLRRDVPSGRGRGRHRMLPVWSGPDEQSCSPLLFVAAPAWPAGASQASGQEPVLGFPAAATALSRAADAMSLQLAGEDEKRLHILALPTAALILLQLASAMLVHRDLCRLLRFCA